MSDSFSSRLRIFRIVKFPFPPFQYTSHTTPLPMRGGVGGEAFFTSSSSFPQVCRGCS